MTYMFGGVRCMFSTRRLLMVSRSRSGHHVVTSTSTWECPIDTPVQFHLYSIQGPVSSLLNSMLLSMNGLQPLRNRPVNSLILPMKNGRRCLVRINCIICTMMTNKMKMNTYHHHKWKRLLDENQEWVQQLNANVHRLLFRWSIHQSQQHHPHRFEHQIDSNLSQVTMMITWSPILSSTPKLHRLLKTIRYIGTLQFRGSHQFRGSRHLSVQLKSKRLVNLQWQEMKRFRTYRYQHHQQHQVHSFAALLANAVHPIV